MEQADAAPRVEERRSLAAELDQRRRRHDDGIIGSAIAVDRTPRLARRSRRMSSRCVTLHLRSLFADDPVARRALRGRSRRPLPRLLEESHHRRNGPSARAARGAVRPARTHRGDVPRREDQHRPKSARCCMWRCARRAASRSSSMATTSCRRFTRCSIGWPRSPTGSADGALARAHGQARSAT